MWRLVLSVVSLPLLAVAGCDDGPYLDPYAERPGSVVFEGPQVNEYTLVLGYREPINQTALGASQQIVLRDAESNLRLEGFEADIGEHLAIESIDEHVIRVRGVTEGYSRLRIWEGDGVRDAHWIGVSPAAAVELGFGATFVPKELVYQGAAVPLVALIENADRERLVDEEVQLVTSLPSVRVDWDTWIVEALPASFDVEIRATGLAPTTFTVNTTDTIDEVRATGIGDLVCFDAFRGEDRIAAVPWAFEITGATTRDFEGGLELDGCVFLDVEDGVTATVIATEPGGLSATVSYEG
jgi:hypothetical protein